MAVTPRARLRAGLAGVLVVLGVSGCVPDAGRADPRATTYLQILGAEDARPGSGRSLELLRRATRLGDVLLRRTAVRALGRLENPSLLDDIAEHLDDDDPTVRAQAAEAIAQALHHTSGEAGVEPLLSRARAERDPSVLSALAHALGRLDVAPEALPDLERAIVGLTRHDSAEVITQLGALLALEEMVRRSGPDYALAGATQARLQELFFDGTIRDGGDAGAKIRALVLTTLGHARRLPLTMLEPAQRDPAMAVRHRAVRVAAPFPVDRRSELLRRALQDPATTVRAEVINVIAADPRDAVGCARLLAVAQGDPAPVVRVLALGALALPCPDRESQSRVLRDATELLDAATDAGWHEPAHALLSLARLEPAQAVQRLSGFQTHSNPFVRAYAARAAGAVGSRSALRTLAEDPDANVRTVAIEQLSRLEGHGADPVLRAQLGAADPQLLLTAARLLAGSPAGTQVATEALEAFVRISEARRETWRDPRRALVELVGELGSPELAPRLLPYVSDYDARVAADVANILSGWTSGELEITPAPPAPLALPTIDELRELEGASVLLHMARGGTIEIELLPYLATTNAFRFARLTRAGYFDGLTFHRWTANFVIQGGSPGANEYSGDGAYTRDEVGLVPHWRGTVGVSTRGHDTGDGQIFVNLADNVRLDHDYTVFGVVTAGMDVVDQVLEGDVIERAELVTR